MSNILYFPTKIGSDYFKVTSSSKPSFCKQVVNRAREIRDERLSKDAWQVGDTFTSNDGVKIHVMDARWEQGKRQLLYCSHGMKVWAGEELFRRVN